MTLQLLFRTIHQQLPYLITVVMELWFTTHFLEYIPQPQESQGKESKQKLWPSWQPMQQPGCYWSIPKWNLFAQLSWCWIPSFTQHSWLSFWGSNHCPSVATKLMLKPAVFVVCMWYSCYWRYDSRCPFLTICPPGKNQFRLQEHSLTTYKKNKLNYKKIPKPHNLLTSWMYFVTSLVPQARRRIVWVKKYTSNSASSINFR